MRRRKITRATAFILAALMTLALAGCGNKSGSTIDEPDVITVEYLSGEYTEQLIRDGAGTTLGTVSIEEANGSYTLTINEMVIVESDITETGYYVADKNETLTVPLDPEARITYAENKDSDPEVINTEDLIKIISSESFDPLEEGNEKLFEVYTISGSAVMLMAKELPVIE